MSVHEFKTWPRYYDAVREGIKTFEVRDCSYRPVPEVGDVLRLTEWAQDEEEPTGRQLEAIVCYVLRVRDLGPAPHDLVVMAIKVVRAEE